MPTFWEYPPPLTTHTIDSYQIPSQNKTRLIHIRSQVKTRQSQSYTFEKKLPKIQILEFWKNITRGTVSEVA